MAHLQQPNKRVNLGTFRDALRKELIDCLNKYPGSKAIVWDSELTSVVGLVVEYSLLRENDVERMFKLDCGPLGDNNVDHVIYFVRPNVDLMTIIAENVSRENQTKSNKKFHLLFLPRISLLCIKKLEELSVREYFSQPSEFCMELVPFDYDLLSMEYKNSFREFMVDDDRTSLFIIARSLITLQTIFGTIPKIYGKGQAAQIVADIMRNQKRELAGQALEVSPQIDKLILVDRSVDLITPLLTQLTYEGLIDEIFGIQTTSVKIPPEKFNKGKESSLNQSMEQSMEYKKVVLNSSDELFSCLRDKNFQAVGSVVSKQARSINAQFGERHAAKSVSEMKDFVSKLQHMQAAKQSLFTQTVIAELIKEQTDSEEFRDLIQAQQEFLYTESETDRINPYIEECFARNEPFEKVIRLICLQSVLNNGLKQKVLDYYRREVIQTYGFDHLVTLHNLEKVGILTQPSTRTIPTLKKSLKLIPEEVNEQNPTDISYVYSGFAPLSVRMVQYINQPNSWRSMDDTILRYLPGPKVEFNQEIPEALKKKKSSALQNPNDNQSITLVYFIGGVTFAEISALRFLSQLDDSPTEYIIATTNIINGNTFINSFLDDFVPSSKNNPFDDSLS